MECILEEGSANITFLIIPSLKIFTNKDILTGIIVNCFNKYGFYTKIIKNKQYDKIMNFLQR